MNSSCENCGFWLSSVLSASWPRAEKTNRTNKEKLEKEKTTRKNRTKEHGAGHATGKSAKETTIEIMERNREVEKHAFAVGEEGASKENKERGRDI